MMQVVFDHYDTRVYHVMLCKYAMLWYASLPCYAMQVCHVMICKFIMLCYASLPCYDMQVYHVMLCKFAMLWYASLYASLSCYDMQVYHVMLCKFDMQVCHMICKLCYASLGLIILFMLSCYASLSWVYEHKASSFMLKVAFWQHVGYHISYDNLHVRLNANLWPFLHVIYHHVSPIC